MLTARTAGQVFSRLLPVPVIRKHCIPLEGMLPVGTLKAQPIYIRLKSTCLKPEGSVEVKC